MKKSAVVIMMFVMFAGSAFASEACKNRSKTNLLSSTKAITSNDSTSIRGVNGTK